MAATVVGGLQLHGLCCRHVRRISWTTQDCNTRCFSRGLFRDCTPFLKTPIDKDDFPFMSTVGGGHMLKNRGIQHVMSPDISSPSFTAEILDAMDDEYGGVVIDPRSLPSSANAFASSLRVSLSNWRLKGKKGIWLKIQLEQADLIPIAIQEGFNYHHAEHEYVMLTYWLPDGPCLLPGSPSHQIGVGGFVVNDRKEVLVVKEKRPCSCSGVWKMPTGYLNKSEDLFSGATREVKEETGVDTIFLKLIAFRHAHSVAFEKSDLLFMCLLNPLSDQITIDENEIQAAKWMPLEEFVNQPFYQEDHMSRRAIEACIAGYEDHYSGFIAHQLTSKLDGKMSYLYYDNSSIL